MLPLTNFDPNNKAKVTGKEEVLKVMLANMEMHACNVRKNILNSTPKTTIPSGPSLAATAEAKGTARTHGKAPDLQHQAGKNGYREVVIQQVEATTAGLRVPYDRVQYHPEMMMRPSDRKFRDGLAKSLGKMDTRSIAPVQPAGSTDPVALQAQAVATAITQYQGTKTHEGIREIRNQALAAYDKYAAESKQELEDLIKKYASGDYLTTPTTPSLGASGASGYFAGLANSDAYTASGAMSKSANGHATSPMEGAERTGSIGSAPVAPMAPPMTTMSGSAGAQQRRPSIEEQRRLSLEGQRIMNIEEQRRRSSSGVGPSGPISNVDASRDPRRRR